MSLYERFHCTTKSVEECLILPIDNITEEVHVLLRDKVNPALNAFGHPCNCGGLEWTRVADLNMADTSETCLLIGLFKTTPNSIRGCENPSPGCHSSSFPVDPRYAGESMQFNLAYLKLWTIIYI